MMNEIKTKDGGQKDALFRRANIKKITRLDYIQPHRGTQILTTPHTFPTLLIEMN